MRALVAAVAAATCEASISGKDLTGSPVGSPTASPQRGRTANSVVEETENQELQQQLHRSASNSNARRDPLATLEARNIPLREEQSPNNQPSISGVNVRSVRKPFNGGVRRDGAKGALATARATAATEAAMEALQLAKDTAEARTTAAAAAYDAAELEDGETCEAFEKRRKVLRNDHRMAAQLESVAQLRLNSEMQREQLRSPAATASVRKERERKSKTPKDDTTIGICVQVVCV